MTPVDSYSIARARGVGVWCAAAALVAVVVFIPSLWNGFAYDDLKIIQENEGLRSMSGLWELLSSPYWPGDRGLDFGLWRPTTSLLLSGVWQVSGGAPLAFHLTNVLLHGAASALVVRVLSGILPIAVAGTAGLVFAIHPVHVEAVANGVGVAELLAAVLLLLALDAVVRKDRLTLRETVPVVVLYALAFGAKESAIVLPGLVFVVDGVRRRLDVGDLGGWIKDRAPLLTGLVAVAGVMLWARTRVLGSIADAMPALGADLLPEIPRIFTLGEIWAHTLRVVTVPTWLSPDYAPGVIRILTVWTGRALLGVLAVLGLLGLALVAMRRLRRTGSPQETGVALPAAVALGVVWFVTTISPTSNALFVTGVLLAERTLYLPSVGAAVVIAGVLTWPLLAAESRPRLQLAAGVASLTLGLAWVTLTLSYTPMWKDQATIFQHMVETVPESARSQWVLGDARFETGEVEGAMRHYRTALGLMGPEYAFLTETGRRQLNAGRAAAARPFLMRAVEERPDEVVAPQLLTVVHAQLEEWPETERWARRTVGIDAGDMTARHLLAVALAEQGRWSEAAQARLAMISLDPEPWQPWFWLAEVRARGGDAAGASEAADSVRVRTDGVGVLRQLDSLETTLGARFGGN